MTSKSIGVCIFIVLSYALGAESFSVDSSSDPEGKGVENFSKDERFSRIEEIYAVSQKIRDSEEEMIKNWLLSGMTMTVAVTTMSLGRYYYDKCDNLYNDYTSSRITDDAVSLYEEIEKNSAVSETFYWISDSSLFVTSFFFVRGLVYYVQHKKFKKTLAQLKIIKTDISLAPQRVNLTFSYIY